MSEEYVIYLRQMSKPKNKKELPEVINIYLCDSIYNPDYTKNLDRATRFYDLGEAKETADLLAMHVGKIEITIRRV